MTMFKLTNENWVVRKSDGARIPTSNSATYPNTNPDYLAYSEWLKAGGVPEPADPLSAEMQREVWKASRAEAVAQIKVTTQAGHVFDGDEVSQGRMARAIIALQSAGAESVTWVLADNSVIDATAAELAEALALAGAEQARLWVSA